MNRIFLSIVLIFAFLSLRAQDTITVMQYNLLEYGNHNSAWAECYESNNNTQEKDECIRKILNYVQPDILTVNEFGATQAIQDNFIRHNLNINGVHYWRSDNIVNYANSNIINHIFYNSDKMTLKKHAVIRTSVRDIDAYELYFRTAGLAANDTIRLVCIVAHLKAGNGYEGTRRAMLQNVMDYVDENYPTDNVLIMGDFNMYSASESGYRLLTQTYENHDILFVDPLQSLGGVGDWDNNGQYANFHTQSTMDWSNNPCRSGGGMDSRFDFILMADEIYMGFNDVRYVNNSYRAIGNDGQHFNRSINDGYNAAVTQDLANALYTMSDHLPVTMKLAVYAKLGVDENALTPEFNLEASPNPAHNTTQVCFYNRFDGPISFDIYNMEGQLVRHETEYFSRGNQLHEVSLEGLAKGMYALQISNSDLKREVIKLVVL